MINYNGFRTKATKEINDLKTKVSSYEKELKSLTELTNDLVKSYTKLTYDFNKLKRTHSSLSSNLSNINSKISQLEHHKSR